jgi:hypothetical protein
MSKDIGVPAGATLAAMEEAAIAADFRRLAKTCREEGLPELAERFEKKARLYLRALSQEDVATPSASHRGCSGAGEGTQ